MVQGKVEICGVNTSKLPVVKSTQQDQFFERIKQGDEQARQEYIEGNLRLVLSVIKRFAGSNENVDDLFQIGCIGLIKAIDNFDTTLNVKFSTYAVPMIIGEIRRFLRDNSSIRVSRSLRDIAYKAIYAKENYIKNLFNFYKVNEIEASLFNNYRNKVTFHIFNSKLGFYNSNSNDLVEIDNCLLLDKDINNLIPKIKTLDLTNIKEIMIRKAVFNNEILMSFKGNINKEKLKEFGKENNITSLSLNDDVIYGKSYIKEIINNLEYTINKDSFFQVNTTCMIKLYDKVKEYAKKGNNLLDLYCGTGTIGMYLKDSYKYILGVEENSFAIDSFNINKKINNIKNIDFKCMDASNIKIGDFDTVVVDPPRSGLSKKVINNLLNKKCKRIVYVSCNPKTLYKDIKLLEESYKVISLTPFNMFPKTKHIETVCLLEKE